MKDIFKHFCPHCESYNDYEEDEDNVFCIDYVVGNSQRCYVEIKCPNCGHVYELFWTQIITMLNTRRLEICPPDCVCGYGKDEKDGHN